MDKPANDWGTRLEEFLKDEMDARSFTLTLRYEMSDGAGPVDWPYRIEMDLELSPVEGETIKREVEATSWAGVYFEDLADLLIKQLKELNK